MKASDIRDLPDADIDSEIAKRRKKLFEHRFSAGQEEKQRAGEIRAMRREIARMLTIQHERQLAARAEGTTHDRG
jgi:large subunit ribosomal protein L29